MGEITRDVLMEVVPLRDDLIVYNVTLLILKLLDVETSGIHIERTSNNRFFVVRIADHPSTTVNVVLGMNNENCIVELNSTTLEGDLLSHIVRRFMVRGMNSEKPTVEEEKEE